MIPITIHIGDALTVLKSMPDERVNCCVTSPPYWSLRDYQVDGQLGLEKTPEEYVSKMVEIFHEVKRVLKKDGTCWLNMGDSYAQGGGKRKDETEESKDIERAKQLGYDHCWDGKYGQGRKDRACNTAVSGLKQKDLCGIPWRLAFALQADGWYLRQDIIWQKPNPMPESVTDRNTKSHEYIFLLTKSAKYWYDAGAISEPVTESTIKQVALAESRDEVETESKELVAKSYKRCANATVSVDRYSDGRDHLVCKPRMKNIQPDGQVPNSFHVSRAEGEPDKLYPVRNRRSVWTIPTQAFSGCHFATFPEEIPRLCISAGCPPDGVVLDPFMGSGTSALVAAKLGRASIGIELNPKYVEIMRQRLDEVALLTDLRLRQHD